MRLLLLLTVLFAPLGAQAFSYATGGCATGGCAQTEQWEYTNANEVDAALDAIEAVNTSQASTLSALGATYLALAGGSMTGDLDMGSHGIILSSGATIAVGPGAIVGVTGNGVIRATAMSASGQIDDNDLAASAVDGGVGGEIQDATIDSNDIATGGVTGANILDDTVALITDTAGNFVATITGDSEITVTGSGTEGRAVTLAIASSIARVTDVTAKSAASSTDTAIAKFSGTSGDIQNSGVTIDSSNNITSAGNLLMGGSTGASTFTMRNTVDSGWVECGVVGTTMTCAVDADGTPDGTL